MSLEEVASLPGLRLQLARGARQDGPTDRQGGRRLAGRVGRFARRRPHRRGQLHEHSQRESPASGEAYTPGTRRRHRRRQAPRRRGCLARHRPGGRRVLQEAQRDRHQPIAERAQNEDRMACAQHLTRA